MIWVILIKNIGVANYTLFVYNKVRKQMKRKDFIKLLENNGWILKRNGANHDIYKKNNEQEAIPRHKEIDEILIKVIIKRRRLK